MVVGELSDVELMEFVKCGDFIAFDELYRRYSGPVLRFLVSLTGDRDAAEDGLQEVFLRLYKARHRYAPTGNFSTYIFRIARNYYLSQRRKPDSRQPTLPLDQPQDYRPFADLRASERVEPEVHLLEKYRRWKIVQAIQALPEHQKMVFVMSHLEDMKYAQISEVLGVPAGTVKSRMFAAVRTLRAMLEEDESEL